jgi:hypothetical protein
MAYFLLATSLTVKKSERMKTLIFTRGRWVVAAALLLITFSGYSQNVKLTKQERKAARNDIENYNFQVLDTMLQNKNFVLEADFLENPYGMRRSVSSGVNFIMVDSTRAVLQTSTSLGMGYNGLGGVTAEGNITSIKMTKNIKAHSFLIRFTVVTDIGIYDVVMTVRSNKLARAEISGLTPGVLIYDGRIENINESGAYKGRNSI